jgi:hypothetical protein
VHPLPPEVNQRSQSRELFSDFSHGCVTGWQLITLG